MVDTMYICVLCDSAYVTIKASERSGWWGNCCDLCVQMENLRHLEMQVQIYKEELNSEVPSQFSLFPNKTNKQTKQTTNRQTNKNLLCSPMLQGSGPRSTYTTLASKSSSYQQLAFLPVCWGDSARTLGPAHPQPVWSCSFLSACLSFPQACLQRVSDGDKRRLNQRRCKQTSAVFTLSL